ncbi:histidine phosphatase family protein [Candidatus Woesearchaeota archaeon]|nr:histidine phosphatase family protein [Candidatus Woesearchaeota archaeon]
MKLHIYIFRHGETYWNKNKIFCGWRDSKLTPNGVKQARALAKRLKGKKFQAAYYTRLTRSKQTLKEVLKYHPECKKLIKDDRIIERRYGRLQGKKHATIIRKVGKKQYDIWHRSYAVPPPGGESVKMVEKRVYPFVKDLIKMMKKEKVNVAVSAHNNSMRPFRKYFEKLTVKQMMKLENPWDNYFEYTIEV